MYAKLCSDLEKASHSIATLFVRKMYDIPDDKYPDEIYFIGNDPTGTLWYGDEFWPIDTMYETLLHNYNKEDVWNYYNYSLEHYWDSDAYINLWNFVRKYPGYTWDIADIAKKEKESREANTRYWNSHEGKAETEKRMKEMTDEFLKTIEN